MTWGQDFLQRFTELQNRGDFHTLMRERYHDDAELVTFESVRKGKDAIAEYLKGEPAQVGRVSHVEQVALAESDDVLILTAIVTSGKMGRLVGRNAFYFKDGKVLRHITLTLPPDKDVKSEWE